MRHTLPVLITLALAASAFAASTPRSPATLDDGPGAGGGYGKQVHTLDDGPGAGGGYDAQGQLFFDPPSWSSI